MDKSDILIDVQIRKGLPRNTKTQREIATEDFKKKVQEILES
jgi:hypothetical protein